MIGSNRRAADSGLFRTTARIAVSKALSSLASAGVVIATARQLGPGGRGSFVLVFTLATFSMIVCGLGVNISARLQLVAETNPVASRDYLGFGVALAALQAAICVAGAAVLLPLFDVHLSHNAIALVGALGAAMFLSYIIIDALNAYGFNVAAAVVDATGSALQLALVVGVAVAGSKTLEPFLAALTAAYVFQSALAAARLARFGVDVRPRFRGAQWRRLLRHGPSGMAIQIGQLFIFKLDRYLVALFLTPAAVGVYSVAAAFPEMLRVVPLAMAQPVLYGLSSRSASSDDFVRARRVCLIVMGVAAALMAAAAPLAVRVLFGAQYGGAVTPLRVLVLAELGLAVYYLDGAALTGQRRVRETALAVLIGLVVALVGYVALIPGLGINGAAIASVIAYASMGIVARARLRKRTVADAELVAVDE